MYISNENSDLTIIHVTHIYLKKMQKSFTRKGRIAYLILLNYANVLSFVSLARLKFLTTMHFFCAFFCLHTKSENFLTEQAQFNF